MSLHVERVGFDVTDQRVGAAALKVVNLSVERLVVSVTPTNTTFGTAFVRAQNLDHRTDNVYHRRRTFICGNYKFMTDISLRAYSWYFRDGRQNIFL